MPASWYGQSISPLSIKKRRRLMICLGVLTDGAGRNGEMAYAACHHVRLKSTLTHRETTLAENVNVKLGTHHHHSSEGRHHKHKCVQLFLSCDLYSLTARHRFHMNAYAGDRIRDRIGLSTSCPWTRWTVTEVFQSSLSWFYFSFNI